MSIQIPIRLGPAELTLIEQLQAAGASAEAERLAVAGLPTRKVESYHYTDLKMLLRAVPAAAEPATDTSPPRLRIPGAFQIMIANGKVQGTGTAPAGVIVGTAAGSALTLQDDILVRLNIALAKESLTLNLDGSVDPVIHIDRRSEGPAGHSAS
jgi:Fe-S cluster assembly protein SufD